MKVNVKVGDTVLVNSGKDSGKQGKVLKVIRNKDNVRVIVEGVNIVTKAKKARTAQDKSELVKQEAAVDISNVNVICPACKKAVRVGHKIEDGRKIRICTKCHASLDFKYVKPSAKKAEAPAKADDSKETKAEKPAKQEKSKVTKSARTDEKATKVAVAKKPTTTRSAQRGV